MSFSIKGVTTTNEHLGLYLRLLGYKEDKLVAVLENPGVFDLPNPGAFQKVIRFLFGVYDSQEADKRFRGAWPPLDKKQEADFRKRVLVWYKVIQSENPELVPVTGSLFLSPGGHKFNLFLTSFLRFIVIRQLNRGEEAVLGPEIICHPDKRLKTSLLNSLKKENLKESRRISFETQEILRESKSLGQDQILPRYRQKRELLSDLERQENSYEEEPLNKDKLLTERIALEEAASLKRMKVAENLTRLKEDLATILTIGEKFRDRKVLDLTSMETAEYTSLYGLIDTLLNKIKDSYLLSRSSQNGSLSKDLHTLIEVSSYVERLSRKLKQVFISTSENLVPRLISEVSYIFNKLKDKGNGVERAEDCLFPPTPVVDFRRILSSENEKSIRYELPYEKVYQEKSRAISRKENAPFSDSEIVQPNSSCIDSVHTTEVPNVTWSTTNSQGEESSHISVFSPILSSSRMIPPSNPQESITSGGQALGLFQMTSPLSTSEDPVSAVIAKYRNFKLKAEGLPSANSSPKKAPREPTRQTSWKDRLSSIVEKEDGRNRSSIENGHISAFSPETRIKFSLYSPETPLEFTSPPSTPPSITSNLPKKNISHTNEDDLNVSDSVKEVRSRLENLISTLGVGTESSVMDLSDLPSFDL